MDSAFGSFTYGVVAAIFVSTIAVATGGPVIGLAAFGALFLVGIFWLFGRNRPELAPLLLIGAIFFFDMPGTNSFYNWFPFTKAPGDLLMESMSKSLGLGLPVSLFEALSMVLAAWLALKRLHKSRLPSPVAKTATMVALLIPAAAAFGVLHGVARGNSLGEAITQTRAFVSLPVWFFIGWCLGHTPRPAFIALVIFTADILFKCLQGIYMYLFFLHREMGRREFLIDHLTSNFILASAFFLCAIVIWYFRPGRSKLLLLVALLPFSTAFLLNNRRSAMIGLIFSLAFVAFAMPRGWLRRVTPRLIGFAFFGLIFIAGTWNSDGPIGFAAHTVKSIVFDAKEPSRDYRIAENTNLYNALSENILLGSGLGKRFTQIVKMDDISNFYENFDLIPHNSLVSLWAFIGPVGISAFALFVTINLALLTRFLRRRTYDMQWIVAWTVFTMLIQWMVFVYSDLGLYDLRSLALIGFMLGTMWRLSGLRQDVPQPSPLLERSVYNFAPEAVTPQLKGFPG